MTPQAAAGRCFCESQIQFHESAVDWYVVHDQPKMADWSRGMVVYWRAKLKELDPAAPVETAPDFKMLQAGETENRWD